MELSTPPVGINLIFGKAAPSAFIAFNPPNTPAGKNFTTSIPNSIAFIISVGVTTPGKYGILFALQTSATDSLKPGETINFAPALIASSHCSLLMTVPAPTITFLNSLLANSMHSFAQSVLKQISATGTSPSSKAPIIFLVSSTLFKTTTGTIPIS